MELNGFSKRTRVYSDNEYISGLKRGDDDVIKSPFFSSCSYAINDIRIYTNIYNIKHRAIVQFVETYNS